VCAAGKQLLVVSSIVLLVETCGQTEIRQFDMAASV
jgi:exosome complex RNA-binding protein Csl4